jgi:hypothetical protein
LVEQEIWRKRTKKEFRELYKDTKKQILKGRDWNGLDMW